MKKSTLHCFLATAFSTSTCRLFLVLLFAGATALPLFSQATLSIQGVLKKSDGSAVPDDEYSLTFTLWKSASGTSTADKAWAGTLNGVETKGGVYSVVLGDTNNGGPALTAAFDQVYWLGVKIGSGQELFPRPQLTHAPYALSLLGSSNVFPSAGNVGVGTANPSSATLVVAGTMASTGNVGFGTDPVSGTKLAVKPTSSDGASLRIYNDSGTEKFTVNKTGDVDAVGKMKVTGDVTFKNKLQVDSAATFSTKVTMLKGLKVEGVVPPYVHSGSSVNAYYTSTYTGNPINSILPIAPGPPISNTSILADGGHVDALGYYTQSDRRIKTAFHHTTSASALSSLLLLQPTEYKYIDPFANGGRMVRGFIAQEVKEVIPEAVSYSVKFIPSIFAKPVSTSLEAGRLLVEMSQVFDLKKGDKIRLYVGDTQEEAIVSAVLNDRTFTVDNWAKPVAPIFVYGKEINDFHVIDFDQMMSLNVSATQELAKRLELLEKENAALRTVQNSTIQQLENFAERLKKLEAQLEPNGSK